MTTTKEPKRREKPQPAMRMNIHGWFKDVNLAPRVKKKRKKQMPKKATAPLELEPK